MNKYFNKQKVFESSDSKWNYSKKNGVCGLVVNYAKPPFMIYQDKPLINMASCSYLGLDSHPHILKGAVDQIHKVGSLHLTTPRHRMCISSLIDVEEMLSQYFKNIAISYISCAAASSTFLPLYASGILSPNGNKPFMIFDKQAHFSINHIKPICADETNIVTCNHNDINYIEDMCKLHKNVAYITDGVNSINGLVPVDDLIQLQDKYGLFVYYDDSHGVSIMGDKGPSFILSKIPLLNENTVIVASLAKAFGACGGVLLTNSSLIKERLIRYGNYWSQYLNSPGIGAIMSSLEIHNTNEVQERHQKWQQNLHYVDQRFPFLLNSNTISPTRILHTKTGEQAVQYTKTIFDNGFFVSPVFFPTVPKSSPGIRFMPRADMDLGVMEKFCNVLSLFNESEYYE